MESVWSGSIRGSPLHQNALTSTLSYPRTGPYRASRVLERQPEIGRLWTRAAGALAPAISFLCTTDGSVRRASLPLSSGDKPAVTAVAGRTAIRVKVRSESEESDTQE